MTMYKDLGNNQIGHAWTPREKRLSSCSNWDNLEKACKNTEKNAKDNSWKWYI